jgi:hypothetical protein
MNVPQENATDITYPSLATFSWDIVEEYINDYQTYSPTNGYYLVNSSLLKQFKIPGFAATYQELDEWMQYTTDINGNVLAFLYKDSMMKDYAYMIDAFFIKNNFPIFIYCGLGSIVPSETQQWIYNKVQNNKLSKLLVISSNDGGYHTPFLPSSIAKNVLFQNIQDYIINILNNNNTIYANNYLYNYYIKMLQKNRLFYRSCKNIENICYQINKLKKIT